jgi:hypothetical protein
LKSSRKDTVRQDIGKSQKGGPREYTHTHMGIHKDILKKGKKNSINISSFST